MTRVPAKIARIEVIPVRVPLATVFRGSNYSMRNRCTIITRVHTDDGRVGEAYNGDADEEQTQVVAIIENELCPRLLGLDGLSLERCWEAMLPSTLDILRDRTLALQAIACVDSALWDLLGKTLGLPLSTIWGGYSDQLPFMAIAGYYSDDPQAVEKEAQRYLELGLGGCKFKVGGRTPEVDADRVHRLRREVGDSFLISADANQGYDLRQAVRFAQLVADCNLLWFEEPCHWQQDHAWMRDLRLMTGIPITAGQSETTPMGVRSLISGGSIDYCNFDASWSGGPTQWRRVAGLAALFGVRMAHHEEPQISAQLLAALSHGTVVEGFLPERDPIFWNMIGNRRPLAQGLYPVPDEPGWGLQLDPAFVARYRADRN